MHYIFGEVKRSQYFNHKGVLEPIKGFSIVQAQHDAAIVRPSFIYVVDRLSDQPNVFVVGSARAVAYLRVSD